MDYNSKEIRLRKIFGWAFMFVVICLVASFILRVIWGWSIIHSSSSSLTWITRFNDIRGVNFEMELVSIDFDWLFLFGIESFWPMDCLY